MRNVEGSKEFVAQRLRRLFEGHGVKARVRAGRLEFPEHPNLWASGDLFVHSHSASIAQLDVRLGGFDGERVLVESIAGFGKTLEEQGDSALQAFANGSFHVLLAAFFGGELCHGTQRETWSIGSARHVYTGPVTSAVGEPPRTASGTPDVGFHAAFTESVRSLPLPAGTHWIRLYQARRANGEEVANEALLDNDTCEDLQAVMAKVPWPTAEKAYDVRTFLVIKDAAPSGETRPSDAGTHVLRKQRRNLAVAISIAALLALAVVFFAHSERRAGPSRDLTTDTDSASIPTASERVAFIRRYVKTRGPVTDADFHVVFHDNSHGIPGPSDWSIGAVLRVDPRDRDAWLVDAAPTTAAEDARSRRSIPPDWGVTSQGETYRRGSTTVVWHPEGIIEISSSTF
jgi:hypothetical protein